MSSGFDAILFHQVLHYLDDPQAAIVATAGMMRAGGSAVDAAIASDLTISTAAPPSATILAITGGSNAQIGPEIAKVQLLFAIVRAILTGRLLTDTVSGDYAALATEIASYYSAAVTQQAAFVP